jgi:hypothetical protein
MGQTAIEQEIIEDYSYIDKNGNAASVQIAVMEKASGMTATIDFEDAAQHTNFIRPAWLTPMGSEDL